MALFAQRPSSKRLGISNRRDPRTFVQDAIGQSLLCVHHDQLAIERCDHLYGLPHKAALLLGSGQALAGNITCNVLPTLIGNVTFNLSDYNAVQPGQVLDGNWREITSLPERYSCAFSGHGSGTFLTWVRDMFQVPQPRVMPLMTVFHEGRNHYVYQVPGIPNLGYILKTGPLLQNTINNDSSGEWKIHRQFNLNIISTDPATQNNALWYTSYVQLVKLQDGLQGPFPINVNFVLMNESYRVQLYKDSNLGIPPTSSVDLQPFAFNMNVNVIDDLPRSCTTPSVPLVVLPMVNVSDFTGPGSTTGEKPFEIKFQDCTDNLASITYKFTPSNSVPSPNPALGLLGNSGTATGIAVQIVHDNPQRTVHPLNVDAILNDPATGLPVDGEFDFKLRARYYQTGNAAPTAGSVKAAMIVHLVYQ